MKILIIVVVLSIIMSFKLDSDNSLLYQQSLLNHLSKVKTDTIYIFKCFDIDLPYAVEGHYIVDISENTSSFLDGKSSLYAIKLMPIQVNKGIVEITLVDYMLINNLGEIQMSNTGSVSFSYKYKNNKYKFLNKTKSTI